MDQTRTKTQEQTVEAVFALDLDPIKFKLMDKREGEGWSRAEADYHELEYRRYLVLLAKYPEEVIAPSSTVDKFWHAHILDTMKYAQDCDEVFGYFLHHFPYFGLRDAEDAENLACAAGNMRRLYEQEFGKVALQESSYCARAGANGHDAAAYCAKVVVKETTAYCAKAAVQQETAYCAKATQSADMVSVSYCARTTGHDTAYCAKAASDGAKAPAYCAKSAEAGKNFSYCAKAAGKKNGRQAHDVVTAKGRPSLALV
jgi:hypothetical protein